MPSKAETEVKPVDLRQETAQILLTILVDFAKGGVVPSEAEMINKLTDAGLVLAKAGDLKVGDQVVLIQDLDFFYNPRQMNSPYDPPVATRVVTGKKEGSDVSFTLTSTPLGLPPTTRELTCSLPGEERLAVLKRVFEAGQLSLKEGRSFNTTTRKPESYPFVVTGFTPKA